MPISGKRFAAGQTDAASRNFFPKKLGGHGVDDVCVLSTTISKNSNALRDAIRPIKTPRNFWGDGNTKAPLTGLLRAWPLNQLQGSEF